MNKTDIKNTLKRETGGKSFVTKGDIKRIMGWGNDRTAATVKGLDCIKAGRTRQYLVDDVAARISAQIEKSFIA